MFNGLPEFREWLQSQGFRIAKHSFRREPNLCDWYAYRRSELEARRCDCNDDKPGAQIVVYPNDMTHVYDMAIGCEVEVCGQAAGHWWNLRAYSIKTDELMAGLPEIERRLIAAWNALA